MKRCGHSYKNCSTIPVHMKHLAGKMIHYGTKFTYICVRIHNSRKILFLNCTPPPLEGTQYFKKLTIGLRRNFFGMALNLIFKILCHNLWFSNKIKLRQIIPQVCYNLYAFQVNIGRRF